MIVNEEEALSRVNSPDNLITKLEKIKSGVVVQRMPQSDGPRNIPEKVKELIGVMGVETSLRKAGDAFGVGKSTVDHYIKTNDVVKEHINTAHENALEAMITAIGLVKDKLPSVTKATDLSKIAADMGRVIEKTSPKESSTTKVQVLVYAPRMKSENEFEEISA